MRQYAQAFLLSVFLFFAGCALFTPITPETPRESLYQNRVLVEAIAETTLTLHQTGSISDEERARVKVELMRVNDALSEAEVWLHMYEMTDPDTEEAEDKIRKAQMKLEYAERLLLSIQKTLEVAK